MVLFALVREDDSRMALAKIQDPETVMVEADEETEMVTGLGITELQEGSKMGYYRMGSRGFSDKSNREHGRPPDISISPPTMYREMGLSSPISPVTLSRPRTTFIEEIREHSLEEEDITPDLLPKDISSGGASPISVDVSQSPNLSNMSTSSSRRISRLSQLSQMPGISRIASQLAHLGSSYGIGSSTTSPTASQLSGGSISKDYYEGDKEGSENDDMREMREMKEHMEGMHIEGEEDAGRGSSKGEDLKESHDEIDDESNQPVQGQYESNKGLGLYTE